MTTVAEQHEVSIEVGAWLPPDGCAVYYYPDPDRGHGKADIVCRVTNRSGDTWYAAAEHKYPAAERQVGQSRTAFVMPDDVTVYFQGFLISAEDPRCWTRVELDHVEDYQWSPDRRTVVFSDTYSLAAYDADGLRWVKHLDYLAWLKIALVDEEWVRIEGQVDPDVIADRPIALRLTDGVELFN